MNDAERELDELFRAYRQSFADVDGSNAFTPGLWEKIEARRSLAFRVTHVARAFLGASVLLFTLLFGVFFFEQSRVSLDPHESYLDSLASAHATDSMIESMHSEVGEAPRR